MDGELVLATPPELGWTRSNERATADVELLVAPEHDEESCGCELACDPCLNEMTREATAHG